MYGYHKKQYHRLCICLLSVIFSISCPVYAADTPPSSDTLSAHNTLLLDTAQSLSTMTDRTEEMKNLLIDAQIQEARQYQMMRLRIQWLYETGYSSFLEQLLSASDFPDFLNRSEQIRSLITYDRNQLTELSNLRSSIETDAALLTKQCDLLRASRDALSMEYEKLLILLNQQNTASGVSVFPEVFSRIPELIARADEQIEEGQLAADQGIHAPSSEIRDPEPPLNNDISDNTSNVADNESTVDEKEEDDEIAPPPFAPPPSFSVSASESLLLSALIQCEAGTEDYTAMTALASCILNRVSSPLFPNSISGVIESEPLFSSVSDGRIEALLYGDIDSVCQNAVFDAISGTNPIGSCLYFSPASSSASGATFGSFTFY